MSGIHAQLVFSCMDRRHSNRKLRALSDAGVLHDDAPYEIRLAGGAGCLASLTDADEKQYVLKHIKAGLSLGVEEVILTVHGIGEEDQGGCGGYRLAGFPQEEKTLEACNEFLAEELKQAEATLRKAGVQVPIRLFIVTFAKDGTNLLNEVTSEQTFKASDSALVA